MDSSLSMHQMADRDAQEFEGDLKRYQASNRRSMWAGALALAGVLFLTCMACSAVVLLLR